MMNIYLSGQAVRGLVDTDVYVPLQRWGQGLSKEYWHPLNIHVVINKKEWK